MRHSKACVLVLSLLPLAACITNYQPGASNASGGPNTGKGGKGYMLDKFDGSVALNGAAWWAGADSNNLGSSATYKLETDVPGADGSVGHLSGHLGHNIAPWPWASMTLGAKGDNSPTDFGAVRAIRFRVKGNGGRYRLALKREVVKDYANFASEFSAPKEWTEITVKMSALRQATWGVPVNHSFNDVTGIDIAALDADKDFDLYIDNLEVVLDPKKPNPFIAPDLPPEKIDGTAVVLDDFEGEGPVNGGVWGAEMDSNNLGTIASYHPDDSGDPKHKNAGHLTGKLGKNVAPWPWASLAINIEPNATPTDLSNVRGIRFWAKGSGAYKAVITRKAVTDYGNFGFSFNGPKEWRQIAVPLAKMKQPDWAQKVSGGFTDAISFEISPTLGDAPFDLWIDNVEFVMADGKPAPFKTAK